MAKVENKDKGLVKEIQKVLLDDRDFLRELLQKNIQGILDKEFDSYIQALPYERSEKRKGYRNGSYSRRLKTRVGTMEIEVARDREGNFSTKIFGRYQRSEQAFVLSMTEMYVKGVSTRKVKDIVEVLCGTSVSKSMVSKLSKGLDENITKWRNRALEKEYPYLVVDARYEDIRQDGTVSSNAVLIVIGISESGHREILSIDIGDSESYDVWNNVFKSLKKRGLQDVKYVVSDDNKGLVKAIKRNFQGSSWQRCQVHFMRNFMSKFSKKDKSKYVQQLKDIFSAPDEEQARERKDRLVEEIGKKKREVAEWLDNDIEFCFTVYNLPKDHRKRMRSTNMIERFNQELLRRSRVIRIFPNKDSCIRLFGTMCMEQSEQWRTVRYLDMELLYLQEKKQEEKMRLSKVV
jgi:transposase-like protein